MAVERLRVEVVYAAVDQQWVVALEVPRGTTLRGVLERGHVFERLSSAAREGVSYGIFGVPCGPDTVVGDGDRIEIYRPLADDPKAIRRRRGVRPRANKTVR